LVDESIAEPATVDFHRLGSPHVAFGSGPHRCIGAHLARLELTMFLEEWVRRVREFRVRDGAHIEVVGGTVWVPTALPLEVVPNS
jgi:cytochrome P450